MDLGLMFTILGSALAIVATTIALFLWNRSEANADRRDFALLIREIQEEMKDFHNRLIKIELEK